MGPLAAYAGVQVAGAVFGGLSRRKAAKRAAREANLQAQFAQYMGPLKAGVIRKAGRRLEGEARAEYGSSGVQLGAGGTADTVEKEIGEAVERDAMTAIFESEMEARALRQQAKAYSGQAKMELYSTMLNLAGIGLDYKFATAKPKPVT